MGCGPRRPAFAATAALGPAPPRIATSISTAAAATATSPLASPPPPAHRHWYRKQQLADFIILSCILLTGNPPPLVCRAVPGLPLLHVAVSSVGDALTVTNMCLELFPVIPRRCYVLRGSDDNSDTGPVQPDWDRCGRCDLVTVTAAAWRTGRMSDVISFYGTRPMSFIGILGDLKNILTRIIIHAAACSGLSSNNRDYFVQTTWVSRPKNQSATAAAAAREACPSAGGRRCGDRERPSQPPHRRR